MTRFWWVRHGPTHAKTMVGWSDLPADLSDVASLARLRAYLPDAPVISSDLSRAITTADALMRPRLPHNPALREMHFGAWEQRSFAEIEAETPDHIRAFWETPGEVRPPGGESWNDLFGRVTRATQALAIEYRGSDIIIVAHFGAILCALQQAANLTTEEAFGHRIDNLSVTDLTLGPQGWTVGAINHKP